MSVRRDGATAVLRLSGEADLAVHARLRLRLGHVLADRTVERLVVDLGALEFLDLTGLQALVDAALQLQRRGGELVLRRPGRRVRRLLALVGSTLPVEP